MQVSPRYFPDIGGVETHVKEISERLVARGFDVDVCTTYGCDGLPIEEVINGVRVRRFKSWAPNNAYFFSSSLKLYLTKHSNMYDIVHAHNFQALPALYASQAVSKKFVFTPHYHGTGHSFLRNLLFRPYRYIGKSIFEKADRIICVSEYEKKLILKTIHVNENKISVIPNGVNLEEFKNFGCVF